MNLNKIDIGNKVPDEFNVFIEIMGGGVPVKYEIDKESGLLLVDRIVATSMSYPCDYGFIPHTLAEDGDPLDILLINHFSVNPGAVIKVRPIGVVKMSDEKGRDEKILCVPVNAVTPYYKSVHSYKDLPEILMLKIVHFFERYKDLEPGKFVKVDGLEDEVFAKQVVLDSIKRFNG